MRKLSPPLISVFVGVPPCPSNDTVFVDSESPIFCRPSGAPHRPRGDTVVADLESPIFVARVASPIAQAAIFVVDFESPIFCCPRGIPHRPRGNTVVVDFESPIFVARAASPIAQAVMLLLLASSPPLLPPMRSHKFLCRPSHMRCLIAPANHILPLRHANSSPAAHFLPLCFVDTASMSMKPQCSFSVGV
jgi:hypothetical protein